MGEALPSCHCQCLYSARGWRFAIVGALVRHSTLELCPKSAVHRPIYPVVNEAPPVGGAFDQLRSHKTDGVRRLRIRKTPIAPLASSRREVGSGTVEFAVPLIPIIVPVDKPAPPFTTIRSRVF